MTKEEYEGHVAYARTVLGFGSDETVCDYCGKETAHFDPVLGWVGPKCEKAIKEGSVEPEPSEAEP